VRGDRGRLLETGLSGEIALKEGIRGRGKRGAKHGFDVGDLVHGCLHETRYAAARNERLDRRGARRAHGAEQYVDLVGVEELARFDERRCRIVSRVLYDGLDSQATQLAARLLEIEQEAVMLRHAERAERTGEFGQHAGLDRVLRLRAPRHAEYRQPPGAQQTNATDLFLLSAHFAGRPLAIRSTGPLVDDELVGDKADRGRVHLYEVLLVLAHHGRYRRREHRVDVVSRFEIELDHSIERRRFAVEPTRHGEGGNDTDHEGVADDDVFEPGMVAQPVIFELLRIEVITPVDRPDDLQTPKPAQHGRGVGFLPHLILVRDHLLHRVRRIDVVRI